MTSFRDLKNAFVYKVIQAALGKKFAKTDNDELTIDAATKKDLWSYLAALDFGICPNIKDTLRFVAADVTLAPDNEFTSYWYAHVKDFTQFIQL